MAIYSDAYIERWGRVFVDYHVFDYAVPFENFLQYPESVLSSIQKGKLRKLSPRGRRAFRRWVGTALLRMKAGAS